MSNTNLKIHPKFSSIFPPLSPEELRNLEYLLLRDGLLDYIKTWKGYIIDGHNRYNICTKKGIKYDTYEMDFADENEAELWIRQFGSGRRNLSDYVKIKNAERAVELEGIIEKAKVKQLSNIGGDRKSVEYKAKSVLSKLDKTDNHMDSSLLSCRDKGDNHIDTRKEVAKRANVDTGRVARLRAIEKVATPDEIEKLEKGQVTINEVYEKHKKAAKKKKNDAYQQKEASLKSTVTVQRSAEDIQLFNCGILDADIADNSLDVIITDPPYPREYLDCWKKLAQFAAKKLKDGGVLIAASGQSYLPTVYQNLNIDGLNYYWTNCIYTPGVSCDLHAKRLRTNWKPLLFYVKGEYKRTFQKTDVYTSEYVDTAKGQAYHKWGQSYPVFEQIVLDYTYANDVVCDPFLGGGTTGLACIENKRKFVGIEIDTVTFNTAKERLSYGN